MLDQMLGGHQSPFWFGRFRKGVEFFFQIFAVNIGERRFLLHQGEDGCHGHQFAVLVEYFLVPFYHAGWVLFALAVPLHLFLARQPHLDGIVVVNGTDETAFIQAIIGTHGAFGRIDKKPGSSGQEEIAMRRPFLKNSTLQGSDVRMA